MLDVSQQPGLVVRRLLRAAGEGRLATLLPPAEEPYASLVLLTVDHAARPLLLLSDLAEHSRNLAADPRCSLLVEGTERRPDPLVGARASLQGLLRPIEDEAALARVVARHPSAAGYARFRDFRLYRMDAARAHLVAGFGRIHWLEEADFRFDATGCEALADSEPAIVAHMNEDHADAVDLIAARLIGQPGDGWRMTGVDPEGADLQREGARARVAFDRMVKDAGTCRAELVRLTRAARATTAPAAAVAT